MRFRKLFWRACRLRCPLCGKGRIFRGFLRMHEHCPSCGVRFEREPGFFLGSIYFNYGLTSLIIAIAYPVLLFSDAVDEKVLLWSAAGFALIFPVFFFHHARSLWLGFDQFYDPRPEKFSDGRDAVASTTTTAEQVPQSKNQP